MPETRAAQAPRRSHQPAAVRREQILEAALACFAREGFHRTTMDDLARASGLSKGSLYWHFSSKEDVLVGAFDHFVEGLFDALGRPEDAEGSMLGWLHEVGTVLVARFEEERESIHVWFGFFEHPQVREKFSAIYARSRELLASALRLARERGEVRALDDAAIAAAYVALAEGLLLQAVMDPEFDANGIWDIASRALVEGIRS